jgi:hypothetical protein
MADESENTAPQPQPTWQKALGCLGGGVALVFFLLFAIASCTADPKADGSLIVDDEANILAPWAEDALREIRFPDDTPAVVRTVSSIPARKIGTYATDLMVKEPHWQTLRPRGWLRRHIRRDSPSGPGVYVLVSGDPLLLQIRFGRNIRLSAYQQGIAVGNWYRDKQRFVKSSLNRHVVETVQDLAQKMQKVAYPPWPLSWAQYLSSTVVSEIEDWLAPSDGLYSDAVLKNYIKLAHSVGTAGSAWGFVGFTVAVFVLLWLIGKKLLIDRLILPRVGMGWLRWPLVILSNLGLLGMLLTGFTALALMSKGRVEDELALDALGLSFLSTAGFSPTLFSSHGGLWLAVPGAFVALVSEIIQAAEAQKHGEKRVPLVWLAWGCAFFLLPKAIAIVALVVLIWKTANEIIQNVS